jgi:hypothetical protein
MPAQGGDLEACRTADAAGRLAALGATADRDP